MGMRLYVTSINGCYKKYAYSILFHPWLNMFQKLACLKLETKPELLHPKQFFMGKKTANEYLAESR